MDRVIGHLDLDYFYAQIEEVQDPSIRGRPVIVCVFSGRTDDSGVVSTANYRARELGARSGMPIITAKKKLEGSNLAVIKMDHQKYEEISDRVMDILGSQVDILEQTGIDEAFFELTDSTGGDFQMAEAASKKIKQDIVTRENLTCSVGLGRSKVVAKLCSDMAKPAGLKMVLPDETAKFLAPLEVTKLYGVGPKTADALGTLNITKVGELASTDSTRIERALGKKFATYLVAASTGNDEDPVRAGLEPTQFGRIVTLKRDTRDSNETMNQLSEGVDHITQKLVVSHKSFRTLSATAILTDLSVHSKSKTFETPVKDPQIIRQGALSLFEELGKSTPRDFRRAGLRVSGLVDDQNQKSLSEFLQQAR